MPLQFLTFPRQLKVPVDDLNHKARECIQCIRYSGYVNEACRSCTLRKGELHLLVRRHKQTVS